MATTVSLINMKGGVGKTTLAFNLGWYCAYYGKLRVLAIDLDPQSNLSQYYMGAKKYKSYIENKENKTVVDIFEQFSSPTQMHGSPTPIIHDEIICTLKEWNDGSLIHLLPARLELALTLRNPTEKSHLLAHFIASVENNYDLILIDCAPTESILTTAAYKCSRYIVVPVRPEFLATIGLPLLARSLNEYKAINQRQDIDIAGIIFNGRRRGNPSPEQITSERNVKNLASQNGWSVFDYGAYYSDSYQTGSRASDPIFLTSYARDYVKGEFAQVGKEFLKRVGIE